MDWTWKQLAACDDLVTKELIDDVFGFDEVTHKMSAECEPPSELLMEIKQSYKFAMSHFEVKPRQEVYGGQKNLNFGVFTKVNFPAGAILPIVGFLAVLPPEDVHGGKNDFSLYHCSGMDLLMLGMLAFVNSDCSPNAHYIPDLRKGKVTLYCDKEIKIGEEVCVLYGSHYFGRFNENCGCSSRHKHGDPFEDKLPRRRKIVEDLRTTVLVDSSVKKPYIVIHEKPARERQTKPCYRKVRSKRRFLPYQRHKRAFIPLRASSPCEDFCSECSLSPILNSSSSSTGTLVELRADPVETETFEKPKDFLYCRDESCSTTFSSDSSCYKHQIPDSSSETSSEKSSLFSCIQIDSPAASERINSLNFGRKIFENSPMSEEEFIGEFRILLAKKLTYRRARELYDLFKKCMPLKNNLPTFNRILGAEKSTGERGLLSVSSSKNYVFLDIELQLCAVLPSTSHLLDFHKASFKDIVLPDDEEDLPTIYLSICSDGISTTKNNLFSIWPVWISVLNLPPVTRSCYDNLLLGALYGGTEKPDFDHLLQNTVDIHGRQITLRTQGKQLIVRVRILTLVCDMVAKAAILNHSQFNGAFGCPMCYIKGKTGPERSGWVYEYHETLPIRTTADFKLHSEEAEFSGQRKFGRKGQTILSKVIDLPNAAVIDYMHQVLLGVVRKLLRSVMEKYLTKSKRSHVSSLLIRMTCRSNKRGLRDLKDLDRWKASECKLFLFYGYITLFESIPMDQFELFCCLSDGMRLLCCTESIDDLSQARILLHRFSSSCQETFGKQFMVYNMHSLLHLVDQVYMYGPLPFSSMMHFESANYQLLRMADDLSSSRYLVSLLTKKFINRLSHIRHRANVPERFRILTSRIVDPDALCAEIRSHFVEDEPVFEVKQFFHNGFVFRTSTFGTAKQLVAVSDGLTEHYAELCDVFADKKEVWMRVHLIVAAGSLTDKLSNPNPGNLGRFCHVLQNEIAVTKVLEIQNLQSPCEYVFFANSVFIIKTMNFFEHD